ncbi:MAG: putative acyltransferase [Acidimicrobiales bacterium]|nr:putative acyltransferase [Acidimicrobiales bacterium]
MAPPQPAAPAPTLITPVLIDPAYAGYRAGSLAARILPGGTVLPIADALGRAAAAAMRPRRAMVERHQRRVRPDLTGRALDDAVNGAFGSYARYWIESFRLPGTSAADIDAGFAVEGFDHIEAALAAGNGVILALPHLGGWEWAAFWLTSVKHLSVTAVVEPVEPPELAEWFLDLRRSLGMELITLGPSAGGAVARALKANRIVCLLSDRDIGGGGIELDFFGERTTLPAGPATLSLRSGAPILPVAVYFRKGGGHAAVVRPPLPTEREGRLRHDVERVTLRLAAELEGLIRAAPEQWHLMQPNWPSDQPDG